ncbi:MAG: hypothetical protein Q8903_12585 [Bacteroidota bacterium]|nr:hypothetical protein [Bacteroidota bacterium]
MKVIKLIILFIFSFYIYNYAQLSYAGKHNEILSIRDDSIDVNKLVLPDDVKNRITELHLYIENIDTLPGIIRDFNNIESLFLFYAKLKELPQWLIYKKHLRFLEISGNEYKHFKEDLKILGEMKIEGLRLAYLPIDTIPSEISGLKYLQDINFDELNDVALPASFKTMESLTYVQISGNFKSNIDSIIGRMPNSLKELFIHRNDAGYIPSGIARLKNLNVLGFFFCNIKEIPKCLNSLEELEVLILIGNKDIKEIPEYLNLPKLKTIYTELDKNKTLEYRQKHPKVDVR